MKKTFLKAGQIKEIYFRRKAGESYVTIGGAMGIPKDSVGSACDYLRNYERGITKKRNGQYAKAWRMIELEQRSGEREEKQIITPLPVPEVQTHSRMEALETAFANLQEAMADVIVEEVEKRSADAVAKKEGELAEQKEKYEQELLKLQAIIASAKDSSIVGMIQRKWGQQPSRT